MLKLNAAYSKKVPADGEYTSQSYHASIEVDTLAFAVDLIPEVVGAAFLRLIDGSGFKFDAVQFGIHFALSHSQFPDVDFGLI